MVPTNGTCHKLKEELKNDGSLLINLVFLACLDIEGECFSLLFLFVVHLFLLHFVRVCFPSFMFCFATLKNIITVLVLVQ